MRTKAEVDEYIEELRETISFSAKAEADRWRQQDAAARAAKPATPPGIFLSAPGGFDELLDVRDPDDRVRTIHANIEKIEDEYGVKFAIDEDGGICERRFTVVASGLEVDTQKSAVYFDSGYHGDYTYQPVWLWWNVTVDDKEVAYTEGEH